MTVLLFDIGGTRMRMALGDESGVTDVRKIPTPADPHEAVAAIAAYAVKHAPVAAFGGVTGVVEDGVIVSSPHLSSWNGCAFRALLKASLGISVHVQNDAELAGLGEAVYGAGKGKRIVAYLGIGTGVGATLVVDGKVAPHATGFEAGHQVLDIATGATLEGLVSGSALEKATGMNAAELPREQYDRATPALVTGIYNLLLAWSPDLLVLGGSLMNEDNGYRMKDIERLLTTMPSVLPHLPQVSRSLLGDECGLYGALARSQETAA